MGDFVINLLISFVMPIGNLGRDLSNIADQLQSFAKLSNCELILIVDSAPNFEIEKLRKIVKKSSNVSVISNQFGNPGSARNAGLAIASGTWIAFIDSDDKADFVKFFNVTEKAESRGMNFALGSYCLEQGGTQSKRITTNDSNEKLYKSIARNPGIWRMVFKRNTLSTFQFPEIKMAEDQVFLARIGFWKLNLQISTEIIYTYRKGIPGQLTVSKTAIYDLFEAQKYTLAILLNEENSPRDKRVLAILLSNQMLTSIRRLGVRGICFSCWTLLKPLRNFKSLDIFFLLLTTCIIEILGKFWSLLLTKRIK